MGQCCSFNPNQQDKTKELGISTQGLVKKKKKKKKNSSLSPNKKQNEANSKSQNNNLIEQLNKAEQVITNSYLNLAEIHPELRDKIFGESIQDFSTLPKSNTSSTMNVVQQQSNSNDIQENKEEEQNSQQLNYQKYQEAEEKASERSEKPDTLQYKIQNSDIQEVDNSQLKQAPQNIGKEEQKDKKLEISETKIDKKNENKEETKKQHEQPVYNQGKIPQQLNQQQQNYDNKKLLFIEEQKKQQQFFDEKKQNVEAKIADLEKEGYNLEDIKKEFENIDNQEDVLLSEQSEYSKSIKTIKSCLKKRTNTSSQKGSCARSQYIQKKRVSVSFDKVYKDGKKGKVKRIQKNQFEL